VRPGRDPDPSPPSSAVVKKEYSYTSTSPMGRTACTEPQCLYKGALYLTKYSYRQEIAVLLVSNFTIHRTNERSYINTGNVRG